MKKRIAEEKAPNPEFISSKGRTLLPKANDGRTNPLKASAEGQPANHPELYLLLFIQSIPSDKNLQ